MAWVLVMRGATCLKGKTSSGKKTSKGNASYQCVKMRTEMMVRRSEIRGHYGKEVGCPQKQSTMKTRYIVEEAIFM